MTCTCNQTRELDEYSRPLRGDFVEDFEAMLDELDQEGDQEIPLESEGEYDQEAELIGSDERKYVPKTTEAPFRYICSLELDIAGTGRRAHATGTLIGPRTVLTAGHTVRGVDLSKLRVIPGRNGTLEPLPATTAVGKAIFLDEPNFVGGSRNDIAIFHLANPIGTTIGFWTQKYAKNKGDTIGTSFTAHATLPLPAGKIKVNLSGYPRDKPTAKKHGCRTGNCAPTDLRDKKRRPICGTYQYRTYDMTALLKDGILHYLNDTCVGHSGSPVWVRRHPTMGGRVLVGVHISGDDPGIAGKANRAVFLSHPVRTWIAANIQ